MKATSRLAAAVASFNGLFEFQLTLPIDRETVLAAADLAERFHRPDVAVELRAALDAAALHAAALHAAKDAPAGGAPKQFGNSSWPETDEHPATDAASRKAAGITQERIANHLTTVAQPNEVIDGVSAASTGLVGTRADGRVGWHLIVRFLFPRVNRRGRRLHRWLAFHNQVRRVA